MARILVAGCGYVGSALAERLAGAGHTVFGLRRNARALPTAVEAIVADLADAATLATLPPKLDAAFFTAASDGGSEHAYRRIYVEGLRNLVVALASIDSTARLIAVSSTAVYSQNDGAWVDETSAAEPNGFRGRVMLESEQIAHGSRLSSVVVRAGGIYGPGRARIVDQLRRGEITLGDGPAYTNRIHRDDCAGILAHLLAVADPDPLYLAVDNEPADRRTVVAWLADRLGLPGPAEAGPAAAASGKRCRNTRVRASGYRFLYPTFREGYEAILSGEATPR